MGAGEQITATGGGAAEIVGFAVIAVIWIAFFSAGLITPRIGTLNLRLNTGKATLEEVLQATMINLTPNLSKNPAFSMENLITVCGDLFPYGSLAVSPK